MNKKAKTILTVLAAMVVVGSIGMVLFPDKTEPASTTETTPAATEAKQISVAHTGSVAKEFDTFSVKINDAELVKDYEGDNSLKVNVEITNKTGERNSFASLVLCSGIQDGNGLDETSIEKSGNNTYNLIDPGQTISVDPVILLKDTEHPVEFRIEKLMANDNNYAIKKFEFVK